MERMQSTWENQVEINLSESGVHPLTLARTARRGRAPTRCSTRRSATRRRTAPCALRAAIAAMYPGATRGSHPRHQRRVGGELRLHLEPARAGRRGGDDGAQLHADVGPRRARSRARSREWPLREEGGRWRPDLDALASLLTAETKLLLICNPNNPTGARLDAADLDAICAAAAKHGTWVLSDEIYRGAELDGCETPTIWGRYERAFVTSGLSKAYGLPGLRIGWVVGPPVVRRHDLGVPRLHEHRAGRAQRPAGGARARARRAARASSSARAASCARNSRALTGWLDARPDAFSLRSARRRRHRLRALPPARSTRPS